MSKITEDQGARLRGARGLPSRSASDSKKRVWREIRSQHRIPDGVKLKVEIDNRDSWDFLLLKDKCTNLPLGARTAATAAPYAGASASFNSTNGQILTVAIGGANAAGPVGHSGANVPNLRYGSVRVEDAVPLLREEADNFDSFSEASMPTRGEAFVEGDRLYFLL